MGGKKKGSCENYLIENKKKDILELKRCAVYYRENLIGKSFLMLYNDGKPLEILFTKEHFKHLTGISSELSASKFYQRCVGGNGRKKIYINPNEIFTTYQHPRVLALKKMEVFDKLLQLFHEKSYIAETVQTNSTAYSFGILDLELTLLCEKHTPDSKILTPVSLRSKSFLKKSKNYYPIEYTFMRTNPYYRFSKMIYPKTIDFKYFTRHEEELATIIDYDILIQRKQKNYHFAEA